MQFRLKLHPDILPAWYPAFFAIRYPAGYPVAGTGYPAKYQVKKIWWSKTVNHILSNLVNYLKWSECYYIII